MTRVGKMPNKDGSLICLTVVPLIRLFLFGVASNETRRKQHFVGIL